MNRQQALPALFSGLVVAALAICTPLLTPAPAQADTVTLPGTGDSQEVLRELAKSYTEQYPDRQVVVPNSIGSDGGIRVVGTGESPIGRVARRPNDEEKTKYGDLQYVEFARVPVAFVVSHQAGIDNLSEQQLCDVFSGRVRNWQEVGGNDLAIEVQSRPLGSNLLTIQNNIACFAKLEFSPQAHFNERNSDLVASMKHFTGAIGFMPLSEAELHGYHIVTLDGTAPTMPQYKLGIGLGFVYKQALSASIQDFLNYLKSAPAKDIMRKTGHVPVEG